MNPTMPPAPPACHGNLSRRSFLVAATAAALAPVARGEGKKVPEGFDFIDNGQLRLGVKKDWGAGIGWISLSGSDRTLINSWDHGRLVQQSYYGNADDSLWNGKPWRWNPVQGGDWKGHAAKVLEYSKGDTWLKSRTLPKHWASGVDIPEVTMSQEIRLEGRVAHVTFAMTYDGKESHPKIDHEIPAFFTEPDLTTLVLYDGAEPWKDKPLTRTQPGWPNEGRKPTEKWAAYVDEKDFGIGCFVPAMEAMTCYRFGASPTAKGACSYFAPIARFPIVPGTKFSYQCHIAVGTSTEIREAFRKIHAAG